MELRLERRRRQAGDGLVIEDAEGDAAGHAVLAERIEGLLRRRGRPVLSLPSTESQPPGETVGVAAQAVIALLSEAYARSS